MGWAKVGQTSHRLAIAASSATDRCTPAEEPFSLGDITRDRWIFPYTRSRKVMIPNSLRQRGRILLLAVLCLGPWNSAQAQEPASPPWLVGVSLGIPRAYGQSVSAAALASMHWTHYRPNRLTFDGSLGIMPRHLGEGGLALAVRPALAIPIKFTNDLLLMPCLLYTSRCV